MSAGFIAREVRRTNRNLFAAGFAILAVCAAIAFMGFRRGYNTVFGPFPIDSASLVELHNSDQSFRYYVSYVPERPLIDTGFREGTHQHMTKKFVLVSVHDHFLLVILPLEHTGSAISGPLVMSDRPLDRDRVELVRSQMHADNLLPFHLDAALGYQTQGYAFIFLWAGGLALGLWPLARATARMLNPGRHPIVKKLASFGSAEETRQSIDAEMALDSVVRIGRLWASPTWLVSRNFGSVDLTRLHDVIWFHKKSVVQTIWKKRRLVQAAAVIYTRQKDAFEIVGREWQVDAILLFLARNIPWAARAYDPLREDLWKSQPERFIQQIDDARVQFVAENVRQLAPWGHDNSDPSGVP